MEYFLLKSKKEWWWTESLVLSILKSATPNNMYTVTFKQLAKEHQGKKRRLNNTNTVLTNQAALISMSLCKHQLPWSAVYNTSSNFLGGI